MSDGGEEAILRILVADDHPFQRRLLAETLRGLGRVHVNFAESPEQCLLTLDYVQPDIVFVEWDMAGGFGPQLVKRLRSGEAGEQHKRLGIVMVTARSRTSDIEHARNCGVDEFVLRPFSTATVLKRILEVRENRREFVESPSFTGPCRRRRRESEYSGRRRRLFDSADDAADTPDVQIRKGLARMYVERIGALLDDADGAAGEGLVMRDLCLACGQLAVLADDMSDKLFIAAAHSLFAYVKALGADAPCNGEVVKAHLGAIVQLAELPNHQIELRQTVTEHLALLVQKQLRQAGQAA